MGAVQVLPKQVAELIAAGEVIERPASVIKELVENSIDAGAKSITVEIQNGGRTFMRVTDDGSGISSEDVRPAFLRHATSKIHTGSDLDAIATLGFRGEALASICAVSRVEVLTKTAEEESGTHYVLEAGEQQEFCSVGCPKGTTFLVRDLFFNVPARMKFLKKDVTEGNAIATLLDRMAISHPEIGFTFLRDGKQALKTKGDGKLMNAVFQAFGDDFYRSLMPVSYSSAEKIRVQGFITKPNLPQRSNRAMQVFCINGRYVRSVTASAALEQAYRGSILTGKYPSCVLSLSMNCSMLDVNVHPAKLEVRFTDEKPVYDAVYYAVKSALSQFDPRREGKPPAELKRPFPSLLSAPADTAVQVGFPASGQPVTLPPEEDEPEISLPPRTFVSNFRLSEPPAASPMPAMKASSGAPPITRFRPEELFPFYSDASPAAAPSAGRSPDSAEPMQPPPAPAPALLPGEEEEEPILLTPPPAEAPAEKTASPAEESLSENVPSFRLIGEAFRTYIILEYDDNRLMLIDKHAAHERLIYEELKKQNRERSAQYLLEPLSIPLEKNECEAVSEHHDLLMTMGFDTEPFGDRRVLLRSVPVIMESLDILQSFCEIVEHLCTHKKYIPSEEMEWTIANIACKAAVKAGNESHPQELIHLAMELEAHPEVQFCPHGRPVYTIIKKSELERMFRRQ